MSPKGVHDADHRDGHRHRYLWQSLPQVGGASGDLTIWGDATIEDDGTIDPANFAAAEVPVAEPPDLCLLDLMGIDIARPTS